MRKILAPIHVLSLLMLAGPVTAQPCGGNGEPPCGRWVCDNPGPYGSCLGGHTDFTCSGSLQNINGRCLRCGGRGEVTCTSGSLCSRGLNAVPPFPPGAGVCAPCGAQGLPFCGSGSACEAGLAVVAGLCAVAPPTPPPAPCGAAGQ